MPGGNKKGRPRPVPHVPQPSLLSPYNMLGLFPPSDVSGFQILNAVLYKLSLFPTSLPLTSFLHTLLLPDFPNKSVFPKLKVNLVECYLHATYIIRIFLQM